MEETLQALLDVGYYNGCEDDIKQITSYIKDCVKNSEDTTQILFPDFLRKYDCNDYIRVFWSVLVLLYGDYGTSPRFGWLNIEKENHIAEEIEEYLGD